MLVLVSVALAAHVTAAYPFNELAFRMKNFERVSQQMSPMDDECFCVTTEWGCKLCSPPYCDYYRGAKVTSMLYISYSFAKSVVANLYIITCGIT